MKAIICAVAFIVAVVPAFAGVDVSVDTILRPYSHTAWFWWFSPMARARCRGADSVVMSAWFTMFNKHDSLMYRDSLTTILLAPGEDTTLEFASYYFGRDSGLWTARCSVDAAGDTCPANNVVTKRFVVGSSP